MTIRTALRERFELYRPEVELIAEQIKKLGDAWSFQDLKAIRGYIDSGTETNVFRLQSDQSLVAKLAYASKDIGVCPKRATRQKVTALIRGMGQCGLEQIVAFDNRRRDKFSAIICRFVGGPSLESCSESKRYTFQRDEYGELITTFQAMQARELLLRSVSSDVIRSPGRFTVIDYKRDKRQTLENKVAIFGGEEMLLENVPRQEEVPTYGLLYRDVCREVLGGDMAAAIEASWRRQGFVVPA